jgi:arylsulfatase A-like enzyme
MKRACLGLVVVTLLSYVGVSTVTGQGGAGTARRNVVIFVADGLRHDSVNAEDTPALWAIRTQGVHFDNSHSLFPTFTTANASAIATGHGLGDTGDFSNVIWPGFVTFDTGNFKLAPGTPVPFLENDRILADLADHFGGTYLGEETLLALARAKGYNTAAIGKLGPAAIQDITAFAPVNADFSPFPSTIVIDDATGSTSGLPLPAPLVRQLQQEIIPLEAPSRTNGYPATSQYSNGFFGDRTKAGTLSANVVQQQWFVDVTTRAILPMFAGEQAKPFALIFWSRDPDGSQHYNGDSLGTLSPGINGRTSRLGVRNADRNLQQLLAWLDAHPAIKANTDIVVTSDHGFATVSRREIDRTGRATDSDTAKHEYVDETGKVDTAKGTLPPGFLAIDLSLGLHTDVFDPNTLVDNGRAYKKVRLAGETWEHPTSGNGLLGSHVARPDGADARAIVAANGGSDLIYVPDGNAAMVQRIVDLLLTYDYVSGVFVDDTFGQVPGTLPLSAIGLVGATKLPRPAIVVAFKVFYLNPDDLKTAIQIADTTLQEGQGMHGGFGRDSTYNNMAAIGPDFRSKFVDRAAVSNADIVPTLARVLGFDVSRHGTLVGRVMTESLNGATDSPPARMHTLRSPPANGRQTLLMYQEMAGVRYLDAGCFVAPAANDATAAACR